MRSDRQDALTAAGSPVKAGQRPPVGRRSQPAPAASPRRSALWFSWFNAERISWIWVAIVTICVVWQPFQLGFYLDDWVLWVHSAKEGAPFSWTRLLYMNYTDPVRPGCLPGRFIGSSLFGPHPLPWQCALFLVNCAVAGSIVLAVRAITQARTPAARTIATAAGLCWLLLPWNAAARFWSALLPNTSMFAAQGFLCALLVSAWAKDRSRPVAAGALYLWMCLSYQAFYLQWVTIVLIGIVLWYGNRINLRPVLISGIGLLTAQGIAGLWNLYTNVAHYWTSMPMIPNWGEIATKNLLNVVPSIMRSVSEIGAAFAFFGLLVITMWLVALRRSFRRASDRRPAETSALLAVVCILGGLVSILVYSLAGRIVMPTGVDTRSMGVFNFWLLIAGAVLTTFTLERLSGAPRLIFALALAGFGLCLAGGQVLRAGDWANAWRMQKKILAEAPVEEISRLDPAAHILLVNPREINGVPVFAGEWDITNAIPWAYPSIPRRRILVYNHWEGPMKWDGSRLYSDGQPPLDTGHGLYLWRPSDKRFWRPAGPFVINQDLTIDPPQ